MDQIAASLKKLKQLAGEDKDRYKDLELALQHAPILMLDNNEPFRPQLVGYSVIRENSKSPSFLRHVRLSAIGKPSKAVIEYALWWDWDINHLYELEHVWIYLDDQNRISGIEASWHGEVRDLFKQGAANFDGGHPILLVSPGKHGCAVDSSLFKQQQGKFPGVTTKYAGVNGTEQNKTLTHNIMRTPVSDRLVRTYLSRYAFEPSWKFDTKIDIDQQLLIPWKYLEDWIPGRIQLWYRYLNEEITPSEYRPIKIAHCSSIEEIHTASALDMDMGLFNIRGRFMGFPYLFDSDQNRTVTNIINLLKICYDARIGGCLITEDKRTVRWLSRLLRRRNWSDYLMTGSSDPSLISEIKSRLPQYRTVFIQERPSTDLLQRTIDLGASYLHILSIGRSELSEEWIQEAHRAGIGVILGPISQDVSIELLAKLSLDGIVVKDPRMLLPNKYETAKAGQPSETMDYPS